MPERRTRLGVEIARVGRYDLSSGSHEFTRDQLAAALQHAGSQAPVIGIGHTDPRFNVPGQDGDPALGRVMNLRLEEDGDLLIGDLEGLPDWLDDGMEIAYPRRSLEGIAAGSDLRISSVKLLGTTLPGISGLADLPAMIAASSGTVEQQAEHATRLLVAAANLADLHSAFSAAHPVGDDTEWWSIEEVHIDPDELIVTHREDGDRTLHRVPWTADADGNFTFGDMQQVAVQYVEVTASVADGDVVYRAPARRPNPEEESTVTPTPQQLRERLGLAEDASDEDVDARLVELSSRPEQDTDTITIADAEAQRDEAVAAAVAAEQQRVAASAPTAEHLAELRAAADEGRRARAQQLEEGRAQFIMAAVNSGKFAPAVAASYRSQLDTGGDVETATREFIDGLPKNTVPVAARGTDDTTTGSTDQASLNRALAASGLARKEG